MDEKLEVLETARNYINNLKEAIDHIFNYISEGRESEALGLILNFSEGTEWLSEVLVLTQNAHKKDFNIDRLNDLLKEVVDAIENQDYILVGDLFKYEIYELLDEIYCNI